MALVSRLGIRRLSPVHIYYLIMGVGAWTHLQHDTISALYLIREVELGPLELVLVGTVLEVSTFISEVPTGVVADVYSRRISIIVGGFLIGIGYLIVGSLPHIGYILLAQAVGALGFAFGSGALEAWLSDEVKGQDVGRIYLRGTQIGFGASLLGIVTGVALGSRSLALPILVAGGITVVFALVLLAIMPETGFRPALTAGRQPWRAMKNTFVRGVRTVRHRPPLLFIAAITLLLGAASEPVNRLWELHLLENFGFPAVGDFSIVVWFGLINAAVMIAGAATIEMFRRYSNVEDPRSTVRTLFLANGLMIGGLLAFALTGDFTPAVIAYVLALSLWEATHPIFMTWTNQNTESSVRATVFSIRSQADAVGQIGGGPALGSIARARSVRSALVGAVLLLAQAQVLIGAAMRLRSVRTSE